MRQIILAGVLAITACASQPTAHTVEIETRIRWLSDHEIVLTVVNSSDHDACVPNYAWPAPFISADVFRVTDASGRQAQYIGEEPAVVRAIDHRVRARTEEEIVVDLGTVYDFSGLDAPMAVEYRAPFRSC